MASVKIELSEHELDFLHKIHNAQAIREMTLHPGWKLFTELAAQIIERIEDQHLEFAGNSSRDAYWMSGARLKGARDFAKILTEEVVRQVDFLNQPLRRPERPELADFDGELNAQNDRHHQAGLSI